MRAVDADGRLDVELDDDDDDDAADGDAGVGDAGVIGDAGVTDGAVDRANVGVAAMCSKWTTIQKAATRMLTVRIAFPANFARTASDTLPSETPSRPIADKAHLVHGNLLAKTNSSDVMKR